MRYVVEVKFLYGETSILVVVPNWRRVKRMLRKREVLSVRKERYKRYPKSLGFKVYKMLRSRLSYALPLVKEK